MFFLNASSFLLRTFGDFNFGVIIDFTFFTFSSIENVLFLYSSRYHFHFLFKIFSRRSFKSSVKVFSNRCFENKTIFAKCFIVNSRPHFLSRLLLRSYFFYFVKLFALPFCRFFDILREIFLTSLG